MSVPHIRVSSDDSQPSAPHLSIPSHESMDTGKLLMEKRALQQLLDETRDVAEAKLQYALRRLITVQPGNAKLNDDLAACTSERNLLLKILDAHEREAAGHRQSEAQREFLIDALRHEKGQLLTSYEKVKSDLLTSQMRGLTLQNSAQAAIDCSVAHQSLLVDCHKTKKALLKALRTETHSHEQTKLLLRDRTEALSSLQAEHEKVESVLQVQDQDLRELFEERDTMASLDKQLELALDCIVDDYSCAQSVHKRTQTELADTKAKLAHSDACLADLQQDIGAIGDQLSYYCDRLHEDTVGSEETEGTLNAEIINQAQVIDNQAREIADYKDHVAMLEQIANDERPSTAARQATSGFIGLSQPGYARHAAAAWTQPPQPQPQPQAEHSTQPQTSRRTPQAISEWLMSLRGDYDEDSDPKAEGSSDSESQTQPHADPLIQTQQHEQIEPAPDRQPRPAGPWMSELHQRAEAFVNRHACTGSHRNYIWTGMGSDASDASDDEEYHSLSEQSADEDCSDCSNYYESSDDSQDSDHADDLLLDTSEADSDDSQDLDYEDTSDAASDDVYQEAVLDDEHRRAEDLKYN